MGAVALLDELGVAGIRLHREGDRLRAEIPAGGVSIRFATGSSPTSRCSFASYGKRRS